MVIKLVYHYGWIFWHCLFTSKLWEIKLATVLLLGEKGVLKLTLSKHSSWSQVLPSCLSLLCDFQTQTPSREGAAAPGWGSQWGKPSLVLRFVPDVAGCVVWMSWEVWKASEHSHTREVFAQGMPMFCGHMWQRMLWERGAYSAALLLNIRCETLCFLRLLTKPRTVVEALDKSTAV